MTLNVPWPVWWQSQPAVTWSARRARFFIGLIAAFVVVFGIEFIDKVCKIDDPVGAIGVHGMCGAAGTLLTGVFAVDGGLAYGGGFSFLGIQLLGVVSVILWVSVTMIITFLCAEAYHWSQGQRRGGDKGTGCNGTQSGQLLCGFHANGIYGKSKGRSSRYRCPC